MDRTLHSWCTLFDFYGKRWLSSMKNVVLLYFNILNLHFSISFLNSNCNRMKISSKRILHTLISNWQKHIRWNLFSQTKLKVLICIGQNHKYGDWWRIHLQMCKKLPYSHFVGIYSTYWHKHHFFIKDRLKLRKKSPKFLNIQWKLLKQWRKWK